MPWVSRLPAGYFHHWRAALAAEFPSHRASGGWTSRTNDPSSRSTLAPAAALGAGKQPACTSDAIHVLEDREPLLAFLRGDSVGDAAAVLAFSIQWALGRLPSPHGMVWSIAPWQTLLG